MTRWILLIAMVVVLSATAAWLSMPGAGTDPMGASLMTPGALSGTSDGPAPSVSVEPSLVHDFGVMSQLKTGRRQWTIRNDGPGVLELMGGEPACSCTVMNLKKGSKVSLKPGETYKVDVEWETRQNVDAYKKSASIFTNDPRKPELSFVVQGQVKPPLLLVPPDGVIDARTVSNDGPHQVGALLGSPDRDELKLTSVTVSRPDLLEVKTRPLGDEGMKKSSVKAGYEIEITIKPTPKLGAFTEEVILRTDHPDRPEVRLTVQGKVIGPISVTPGIVQINEGASRGGGDSASVSIWAQGEKETEFTVVSKPEKLKVTIARADDKTSAGGAGVKGHMYRMNVTLEPDASPGLIDEPIVLKTNNPRAGEISVPVHVLVLGAG
jgi:hypothetical protein